MGLKKSEAICLDALREFLINELEPKVDLLEDDPQIMLQSLKSFAQQGFLDQLLPDYLGGKKLSPYERFHYQFLVAKHAGAFGFLQMQTFVPSYLLQQTNNTALADSVFEAIAAKEKYIGNCLFQLKPHRKRFLQFERVSGGVEFSGFVEFVSGWGIFDEIAIGACNTQYNQEMTALIPLQENGESLVVKSELDLIAMKGTATVSLQFDCYFVPDSKIISCEPRGSLYGLVKSSQPLAYILGVLDSLLSVVNEGLLKETSTQLWEHYQALRQRQKELEKQIISYVKSDDSNSLSAEEYDFAWRCVEFVTLVLGGVCILAHHPVQTLIKRVMIWLTPRNNLELLDAWSARKIRQDFSLQENNT